jgi:hypothetical protein
VFGEGGWGEGGVGVLGAVCLGFVVDLFGGGLDFAEFFDGFVELAACGAGDAVEGDAADLGDGFEQVVGLSCWSLSGGVAARGSSLRFSDGSDRTPVSAGDGRPCPLVTGRPCPLAAGVCWMSSR